MERRLVGMSTISVPDELGRKLNAAASSRGLSVDELATEVLEEHVVDPSPAPRRRKLAFAAIGSSGEGITHRIDELLADGFGRS